jgi:hypothetical protein
MLCRCTRCATTRLGPHSALRKSKRIAQHGDGRWPGLTLGGWFGNSCRSLLRWRATEALEPEREHKRPTVTEAVNGRDLSLGRAGAGVPVLGLGLRGLLARPVTQAI